MDADDFPIAGLDQMLIGVEIITGAGAGGGRDEFGGYHPAQEFFPLNSDQVPQNLFTTMNIIGNRRDVQVFQERFRQAGHTIRKDGYICHGLFLVRLSKSIVHLPTKMSAF